MDLLLISADMAEGILRDDRHEPVQARGQKTRQRVLSAARKILLKRGYSGARVEEITRVARVGYGTFYKYFRNKQDVLEAVMEDVYWQFNEVGFPKQVEAERLDEQIRTGITNYLKIYYTNRELLMALEPASLMSPRIRKFIDDMRERDVQWMVAELKKLADEGWRLQRNPDVFSVAMLHTVENVARDWITRRAHLPVEEVAETLCEIWFRTVLASRPA